ncbi:MAG: hypothetical protein SOZ48_10100 [Eubacterium sp.]|nr:hypothetical protein [Eubacterium sp.]
MKKKILFLCCAGILALGTVACGKTEKETESATPTKAVAEETASAKDADQTAAAKETEEPETSTKDDTDTDVQKQTDSENDDSGSLFEGLSKEEAEYVLTNVIGKKDKETGNEYSFGYEDTVTVDGVEYYVFDWRMLVDDHTSRITELFVATDGSVVYEGSYNGENSEVYTEKDFLEGNP